MPESLLVLSLVSGVHCFSRWLTTNRVKYLILSTSFISLACLIKIPSLYIGLPILYLAWLKYGKKVFVQWEIWLFGVFVIGSTAAWYYHAHQIYLQNGLTFGIWEYGMDKWGNWALVTTWPFWKTIWVDHLGTMFFAGVGYPIFIAGLLLRRNTPREFVFDYWLASVIVYFLIVGWGNYAHDYYQLPFTIPAAVFLGKVYARYFGKGNPVTSSALSLALLAIICIGTYNYNRIYMNSEDPKKSETYELAQLVEYYTDEDTLIIALDGEDPTLLYLSGRKGWHTNFPSELMDRQLLSERIAKGAKYMAGRLQSCYSEEQCAELRKLLDEYEIVFIDKDYFIVRLSN